MAKIPVLPCLVWAGGMALWNPAASQEPHPDIPSNAHFSAAEQGWTCNEGFRQVAQLCVLDTSRTAERSGFEYSNGQWRCRSGYSLDKGFCVRPTAPEHATFVDGGEHWECNWGFQKEGSHCKEINPPAHGYLDPSGRDWVCYPGYERVSDACVPTQTATPPPADGSGSSDAPKAASEPTPRE